MPLPLTPGVRRAARRLTLAAVLACCAVAPAGAAMLTALNLNVFRDGAPADWLLGNNQLLRDGFDNGDPLLGPNFNTLNGQPANYVLLGLAPGADAALALREQGSVLQLDPSYGAVSFNAQGGAGHSLRLRLLTNINDLDGGLARSRSFATSLRLSLAAMPDPGQSFGFRLADGFSNSSDFIELFVFNNEVVFRKQDFVAGTIILLGRAPLAPPIGAQSLVLALSHPVANTDEIYGNYGYADASETLIDALTTFAAATTAFNGEAHTRIELRATAAVPEPANWALLAGGLALLAGRRRLAALRR